MVLLQSALSRTLLTDEKLLTLFRKCNNVFQSMLEEKLKFISDKLSSDQTELSVESQPSSASSCDIFLFHDNDACDGAGTCVAGTPKVCSRGDNYPTMFS
eukprot:TRINITY_DN2231_c0_g2_i1.p1 TRINITY_DN2231_c0_g2~~TRINITY_DN2231_c0_g2_i1.p1  ORF type:complete len:100 (-),score=17.27 TRINITY_DN2231_c0_g2_i1:24-323(-)